MCFEIKMKKSLDLACALKMIFARNFNQSNQQYQVNKSYYINKEIHIDYLTKDSFQIKYLVKAVLVSLFWIKRYSTPAKFIFKWTSKLNAR